MAKKVLKLPKAQLAPLATWLVYQPLDGKRSRLRTRFVKLLTEEIRTIEEERKEIIDKYTEPVKDKTVDKKKISLKIKKGKEKTIQEELEALYDEDYILSVSPENEEIVATVKDILLNTEYEFGAKEKDDETTRKKKIKEMNDYEQWCEAIEKV